MCGLMNLEKKQLSGMNSQNKCIFTKNKDEHWIDKYSKKDYKELKKYKLINGNL